MAGLFHRNVLKIVLLLTCLLLLQADQTSATVTKSSKSSKITTKTTKSTHTSIHTTKTKASTTKPPTTSSSSSTVSLPVYTFRSAATAKGCPNILTTASLNSITATDSSRTPQFTAYADPSGSVIPQVSVQNATNTTQSFLFNFKNTSRIEMIYQTGGQQRVVIDESGASIYTSDCSQQINLPIQNFSSVINQYGSSKQARSSKPLRRSELEIQESVKTVQRRANSDISFEVFFLDQCGDHVTPDHSAQATCELANPYTGFDTGPQNAPNFRNNGEGAFQGTCPTPNGSADEQQCESTIKSILDWPTQGFVGQLTNVQSDLILLGAIVGSGSVARLTASAAAIFDAPEVAIGIGILAAYQGFIALGGDDSIAQNYCPVLLKFDLTVEAKLDVEPGYELINYQTSAPFTSFTATQTVSISTISSCSPSSSSSGSPISPSSTPCPDPTSHTYAACAPALTGCQGYYTCETSDQECLCGLNADGNPMCFPYGFCIAPDCDSDIDCPCGAACLTADTCCNRSICVDVSRCVNSGQKVKEYFRLGDPDVMPIVLGVIPRF